MNCVIGSQHDAHHAEIGVFLREGVIGCDAVNACSVDFDVRARMKMIKHPPDHPHIGAIIGNAVAKDEPTIAVTKKTSTVFTGM